MSVLHRDLTWSQWPEGVARPTQQEWEAAVQRHRLDMDAALSRGYAGDGLVGLSFMMATYGRPFWWPYFFPEEKLPLVPPEIVAEWAPGI